MSSCTPYQWRSTHPGWLFALSRLEPSTRSSLKNPMIGRHSYSSSAIKTHITKRRPIAANSHGGDAPQVYFILTQLPNSQNLQETQKFRAEHSRRLLKEKETFGPDLHGVIGACAEVISDFLQKEYGGPGTLLAGPCTDILVALKEKELPGAPLAARTSLLWAQIYLDRDWEIRNSKSQNDVSFVINNRVNLI